MRRTIQVFLQLREADRYARAKNPLLRRLAVVLLDNLVELQLGAMARVVLSGDNTTWYSGVRKHDRKVRRSVERVHGDLVSFSQAEGWISKEDGYLLEYVHDVRNSFYHEGKCDALDAELSIRLMYRFVERTFPQWRVENPLTQLSPYEPISIDDADSDETGFTPLFVGTAASADTIHSREYWAEAIPLILQYRPTGDIRHLIKEKITRYIDELDSYRTNLIDSKSLDFNWVVGRRFAVMTPMFTKNLTKPSKRLHWAAAVNIYMAVLKNHGEDRLLDMKPRQRRREFLALLKSHAPKTNPLSPQKLTACRLKAETLLTMSEEEGIGVFLKMEGDLRHVRTAVRELARDLEIFWESESDLRRGK